MSVANPSARSEAEVLNQEALHIPPQDIDTEGRRHEDDSNEPLTLTQGQRKSLVFLQMNTPVSLLCCIATALFVTLIVPSIHYVFRNQPTYFTMAPRMELAYFAVMMVFQIGFCLLALITPNPHTQLCIVEGTGSRLAIENYLIAMWLFLRVMDTSASLRMGVLALAVILIMSIINAVVLRTKYQPRWVHPFEFVLVHIPNKLITVLVSQVLFWDTLMLAWGWDRSNGREALAHGLWIAIFVQVVMGIVLAVWVAQTSDVTVYVASMFLDAAVLKFHKMPVIGPNSRPFVLTAIMCVSMTVRTVCLVVPGLLKHGCLIICHTHRQHRPQEAQPDAVIEEPAGQESDPAVVYVPTPAADANENTRLVQQADPSYGGL
ncbi:hypothetical protein MCAP1_002433 [Malassezia caprae]|uniref:Uncharacterized protein n=1 Tax=Malassezia caprae TaxID=1381934 RepID=A0AAF0E8D3_9BASI|nr:hypothetical protein MCAP1_002433 [Malassezia caprae]